ncbi:MAG: hypothetical protein MJ237_03470 [bacterium]|nr:hypothetical protein [bacterium]
MFESPYLLKFEPQKLDVEDVMWLHADPLWIYEHALYFDIKFGKKFLSYKNVKIPLTPRLFKAALEMASEPYKPHKFSNYNNDNGAAPDSDKKIVSRINKTFKKVGFNEILFKKERGVEGYQIDLKVIPKHLIVICE